MASLQQVRPTPGDVVTYDFIWSSNATLGHGIVARPCLVLHAADLGSGEREAVLLPITHKVQTEPRYAIEVPREFRLLMGLDDRPNFVIVNEANALICSEMMRHPIGRTPGQFLRNLSFAVAHVQSLRKMKLTEIHRQVTRRRGRGR